ncbi:MAG: helix-turn-helix domain-containing protein [Cyclobacteriaceae bacterium]
MKTDSDQVQHFYYHLDETKPIEVLNHLHEGKNGWFDMHYEMEMGIVLSGKMKRSYDSTDIELGAGEVWFCNMWEPHGFQITDTPCEVIVFEIFPPLIHHNLLNYNWLLPFNSSAERRPQVTSHDKNEVLSITSKVKQELARSPKDLVRQQLLMFELIHLVARNSLEKLSIVKSSISSQHRIAPAMELVFKERRFIPLEEAAKVCAMSKNGFSQHFSKLMRTTFSRFALNYRVRGALHDHSHSDKKLEAIATDWGFTDASHLHKYINKK